MSFFLLLTPAALLALVRSWHSSPVQGLHESPMLLLIVLSRTDTALAMDLMLVMGLSSTSAAMPIKSPLCGSCSVHHLQAFSQAFFWPPVWLLYEGQWPLTPPRSDRFCECSHHLRRRKQIRDPLVAGFHLRWGELDRHFLCFSSVLVSSFCPQKENTLNSNFWENCIWWKVSNSLPHTVLAKFSLRANFNVLANNTHTNTHTCM